MRAVAAQYHASAEGRAAAENIFAILDTPPSSRPAYAAAALTGDAAPVPDLHSATIRLTGVTVAYPGRDRPAVDGLDLVIGPGELILLTGPSGAGKTSVLRLLLKFVEPNSGTIRVSGADLAAIPDEPWRAQIAWVPQHPRLFEGSVADNIALGQPGASRAAIEDAARLAGAAAFIEALPYGYDTQLDEQAARLSAGERQQLALARAFLRDAPLLLLDEPTAHLAPAAAVLAAGLLVAALVVPTAGAAVARKAARTAAPARGNLAATVTELLEGVADLHAFGAADTALARAEATDAELARLDGRTAAASALGAGAMSAITGLTVWGSCCLASPLPGPARCPGCRSRFSLTALAAFEAVTALPAAAVQLGQARVAAGRIAAVTDAPDPVLEPRRPRALPSGPFSIQLRDATVVYRPGGPPALDRVSLDLPPGRRVALVGANGAGKSTVAAVLMRFTELTAGAALLNGYDLSSYAADDVRSVIGGCPQNPHLFDATIRDNVRLARPHATDEELAAAAARARLLSWIASLPQGWDTPVGTHGAAVSGGERQRLALARAFLADPPLLILDEPATHLDPPTRRALAADLLHATQGRAVLLITHELEGLDQVDEIVVLDHGRVAEQGCHEQLRHAGGPYQRRWETAPDR